MAYYVFCVMERRRFHFRIQHRTLACVPLGYQIAWLHYACNPVSLRDASSNEPRSAFCRIHDARATASFARSDRSSRMPRHLLRILPVCPSPFCLRWTGRPSAPYQKHSDARTAATRIRTWHAGTNTDARTHARTHATRRGPSEHLQREATARHRKDLAEPSMLT